MGILRKLWEGWKAFGHILGQIQTAILLSIIYHIGVGPIALVGKIMRNDLMQLRANPGDSFAGPLVRMTDSIEQAEKQF